MDYRVDEKGKYYTQRVSKQTVRVVIATSTHLIHGTTHVTPENRLKDDLNNDEHFIAITDAEVFDVTGTTRLHANPVLLLNKDFIVWTMPEPEETPSGGEGAGE